MTLPGFVTYQPPTLLARLFGKRQIAFADKRLICGIYWRGYFYVTHDKSGGPIFFLPRAYSMKNFIPQSK